MWVAQPGDVVDLDGDGPPVEGCQPPLGDIAVGCLLHPAQQVSGDPDGGDLVVGVRGAEPVGDRGHDCLVEAFLTGAPDAAELE
jgi:hypothetical protein